MQAVPIAGSAFTPRPARRVSPPRFGNNLLNNVAAAVAPQQPPNNRAAETLKKRGGVFKLLALTAPLTIGLLTNLTTINYVSRQAINRFYGQPLESVLPKLPAPTLPQADPLPTPSGPVGAPPTTSGPPAEATPIVPTEMIAMLRRSDFLPAPYLYEAAKAGFVKEILVSAPNAGDGIVVLIDGRELSGELTPDLRNRMARELKIPLNRPLVTGNVALLDATLLATLVFSALSPLLLLPVKEHKIATQEEKRRSSANLAGRRIVARRKEVTSDNVSMDEVKLQLSSPSFVEGSRPLTVQEMKKRMAVMMGGYHAEKILFDGDPSLTSAKAREIASQLAQILITRLGVTDLYQHHVPQTLTEAQNLQIEKEIAALVEEASLDAQKILAGYRKEHLDTYRVALTRYKKLSPPETDALLKGATMEDIRRNRLRNWLPFFRKDRTLEKAIRKLEAHDPPQQPPQQPPTA